MDWLILALGVACLIALAAYVVTRTSQRLSHTESQVVYDLTAASDWVIERLPDSVASRLTETDIADLLGWQIDALRRRGVAHFGGVDRLSAEARERVERDEAGLVYLDEDDLVVEVLKRAWDEGRDISEVDVVVVLDAHSSYLRAIRVIGERSADGEADTGAKSNADIDADTDTDTDSDTNTDTDNDTDATPNFIANN